MKSFVYPFSRIILASLFLITLYLPSNSFADGTFWIEFDGSYCVFSNGEDSFDNVSDRFAAGDCSQDDDALIFFKAKEGGGPDKIVLKKRNQFTLKKDQTVVFWGIPIGDDGDGECAGDIKNGLSINCWNGGDGIDAYEARRNEAYADPNAGFTRIDIDFNSLPDKEVAFDFIGPDDGTATVIFRDISISAFCNIDNDGDGNSDPYVVCGPVIGSKNVKVVFENSKIFTGERVGPIVYGRGTDGYFPRYVAFSREGASSLGITEIDSRSIETFAFDVPVLVRPSDFSEVTFSHLGYEDDSRNYFWSGNQSFISAGQSLVNCELAEDKRSCTINDSGFNFDAKTFDNVPHVIFFERGHDNGVIDDSGVIKISSIFLDRIEPPYTLSLPSGFELERVHAITNLAQTIYFVDKPDAPDEEVEETECPENTELEGGICDPKPGYEWRDGDPSTGVALKQCKGDAFPTNADDSLSCAERCACPEGETLECKLSGMTECHSPLESNLRRLGDHFWGSLFGEKPDNGGDSGGDGDGDGSGDTKVNVDDNSCAAMGGVPTLAGCKVPDGSEKSDGAVGGCSLAAMPTANTSAVWFVLLTFPLAVIIVRRARH